MNDYYQILGVPRTATQEQIKERYLFLAQAYHPDKFSSSEHQARGKSEFQRINEAYATLSDPEKRKTYDSLRAGKSTHQGPFRVEPPPRSSQPEFHPKIMSRKLYISGMVILLAIGCLVVIMSTVLAVHDANIYSALSPLYRTGIAKLQEDWLYEGLSNDEQAAILDQHKLWKDQKKLPWWGADPLVDPKEQKSDTLSNFEKLVPRWGTQLHQQRPLLAVAISFTAFLPALALIMLAKWLRWMRI